MKRRAVSTIVAALLILVAFSMILVGLNAVFQRQIQYQQAMREYHQEQETRQAESLSLVDIYCDSGTYYLVIRNDSPFTSRILRIYYYTSSETNVAEISREEGTIPPAATETIAVSTGSCKPYTFKAVTALGNIFVFKKPVSPTPTFRGLIWGGDVYQVSGTELARTSTGKIFYDDFESYNTGQPIDGQGNWTQIAGSPSQAIVEEINGRKYLVMSGIGTQSCVQAPTTRSSNTFILVAGVKVGLAQLGMLAYELGIEKDNHQDKPAKGYAGVAGRPIRERSRYVDGYKIVEYGNSGGESSLGERKLAFTYNSYHVFKFVRISNGMLELYDNDTSVVATEPNWDYEALTNMSICVYGSTGWATDYVSAYASENVTVEAPAGSVVTLSGVDVEGQEVYLSVQDNSEYDLDPRPGYISLNISGYYAPINGTISVSTTGTTTTPPPPAGELVIYPGSSDYAEYKQLGPRELEINITTPIVVWGESFESYSYAPTRGSYRAFGTLNHWWEISRYSDRRYYDFGAVLVASGVRGGAFHGSSALQMYVRGSGRWVRAKYNFTSVMNPDVEPLDGKTVIAGALYAASWSRSYSVASVHLLISDIGDRPTHELVLYWSYRSSYKPPRTTSGTSYAYVRMLSRENTNIPSGKWITFAVDWMRVASNADWSGSAPAENAKIVGIVLQVYNRAYTTTKVYWDYIRAIRKFDDLFRIGNTGSTPLVTRVAVVDERWSANWWSTAYGFPLELYLENRTSTMAYYNYTAGLGSSTAHVELEARSPRSASLKGRMAFFVDENVDIRLSSGSYVAPKGSRLEIVFSVTNTSAASPGSLTIDTRGTIHAAELPVTSVRIDGVQLLSGRQETLLSLDGRANLRRGVESTLTLCLPEGEQGYTRLRVDGRTILSETSNMPIEVYSLLATSSGPLVFSYDQNRIRLDGLALGVRWGTGESSGAKGVWKLYDMSSTTVYGGQRISISAVIASPGIREWGPAENRTIRILVSAEGGEHKYTGRVTIRLPGGKSDSIVELEVERSLLGKEYTPIIYGQEKVVSVVRLKTLQNWVQDYECCDPRYSSSKNYYWRRWQRRYGYDYWTSAYHYNGSRSYYHYVYGYNRYYSYIRSYFDFDSSYYNPAFYNRDGYFMVARGNTSLLCGAFKIYGIYRAYGGVRAEIHIVYYPNWPSTASKRELILWWRYRGVVPLPGPRYYEARDYKTYLMGDISSGHVYKFCVNWLKIAEEKWGLAGSNPRIRRIYLGVEAPATSLYRWWYRRVQIMWDTLYLAYDTGSIVLKNTGSQDIRVKLVITRLDGSELPDNSNEDPYKTLVAFNTSINGIDQAKYFFQPGRRRQIIVQQPESLVRIPSGGSVRLNMIVVTAPPPRYAGYWSYPELYKEEAVLLKLKIYDSSGARLLEEKRVLVLVPYITIK